MQRIPALVLALALAVCLASGAGAQAPATVLSRRNLVVSGSVTPGSGANYVVDYQPLTEGCCKPAPWLLRMYYRAPGAAPGSVGFTWLDQTSPTASVPSPGTPGITVTTAGNMGTSSQPQIGGNATDVPVGTDTTSIQQAVLSGGSSGPFAISVFNTSNVTADYTLKLYPMQGGTVEPGFNPDAAPTPTPAPPPAPPPAAPAALPLSSPPPPFTPFWVKALTRATLYANATPGIGASFGAVPQFACLLVAQPPTGERFYVLNPQTGNYAYVDARDVGGLAPTDRSCG